MPSSRAASFRATVKVICGVIFRAAPLWFGFCFVALGSVLTHAAEATVPDSFAALVERLSEPGGDFGGDNLISNEQSYLHVMPALKGTNGGAFVGVGPDQNFCYIAQTKSEIAYIIDIRRDNLLLHLFFKALFAEAPTRIAYLCLPTGRPLPASSETWATAPIAKLIAQIDATAASPAADQQKI